MKTSNILIALGLGCVLAAAGCAGHATVYVPPPPAASVEVNTSGPAVPPPGEPDATEAPGAPPAPQTEVVPTSPDPTFVWIPGYWSWGGGRWLWIRGYWGPHPRYYHAWAPGRWGYYHGRYVWHRGYWH